MVAECIPQRHKVDLTNPELFILIEVFKVTISNNHTTEYVHHLSRDYIEYMRNRVIAGLLSLQKV